MLRDYLHYGIWKLAARVYNDPKGHVILHDRLVTHAHDCVGKGFPWPMWSKRAPLFENFARVLKGSTTIIAVSDYRRDFQTPEPRR